MVTFKKKVENLIKFTGFTRKVNEESVIEILSERFTFSVSVFILST